MTLVALVALVALVLHIAQMDADSRAAPDEACSGRNGFVHLSPGDPADMGSLSAAFIDRQSSEPGRRRYASTPIFTAMPTSVDALIVKLNAFG